jgi:hypothetical protein
MTPAEAARQSDPMANPQFRRGWLDPPERKRGPAGGRALNSNNDRNSGAFNTEHAPTPARAAVGYLMRRYGLRRSVASIVAAEIVQVPR